MINIERVDLAITSDYCLIWIACPFLCGIFVCLRFENRKKGKNFEQLKRGISNHFLHSSYWSPFRSRGFHKQWDSLLALLLDQAPLLRINWVHLLNISLSRTHVNWSLPFCVRKCFLKPVKIILSCIWCCWHFMSPVVYVGWRRFLKLSANFFLIYVCFALL